jgi:hypothetical protein
LKTNSTLADHGEIDACIRSGSLPNDTTGIEPLWLALVNATGERVDDKPPGRLSVRVQGWLQDVLHSREREYQVVYPYAKPARSSKQDCVATLRFAMGSCAYAAEVLSVARRPKRRPAKEHRIS